MTPSDRDRAARQRAHELLGLGSDCMNHWVGDHGACDAATAELTRLYTEVEELRAERDETRGQIASYAKPFVTLDSAQSVTCINCGHMGTAKVTIAEALADWMTAEVNSIVDKERQEMLASAESFTHSGGVMVEEFDRLVAERDQARAELSALRKSIEAGAAEDDASVSAYREAATIDEDAEFGVTEVRRLLTVIDTLRAGNREVREALKRVYAVHCECRPLRFDRATYGHSHDCDTGITDDIERVLRATAEEATDPTKETP